MLKSCPFGYMKFKDIQFYTYDQMRPNKQLNMNKRIFIFFANFMEKPNFVFNFDKNLIFMKKTVKIKT